jgi:hypothetical protein
MEASSEQKDWGSGESRYSDLSMYAKEMDTAETTVRAAVAVPASDEMVEAATASPSTRMMSSACRSRKCCVLNLTKEVWLSRDLSPKLFHSSCDAGRTSKMVIKSDTPKAEISEEGVENRVRQQTHIDSSSRTCERSEARRAKRGERSERKGS